MLCHLDTVHPKGTLAQHLPFRVDGDRAYGPGIYDMKGGAYLALAAYRAIASRGGPRRCPSASSTPATRRSAAAPRAR